MLDVSLTLTKGDRFKIFLLPAPIDCGTLLANASKPYTYWGDMDWVCDSIRNALQYALLRREEGWWGEERRKLIFSYPNTIGSCYFSNQFARRHNAQEIKAKSAHSEPHDFYYGIVTIEGGGELLKVKVPEGTIAEYDGISIPFSVLTGEYEE